MNLFDLYATLNLDSSNYFNGLNRAQSGAKSFGQKLSTGLATAAKIGGTALVAVTGALVGFGTSAVNTGKDFDSAMSQVAATMGVTVDEIEDLRGFAQEMGASTSFSATQAAEALNYMALAGYDAETAMSALPNVLNLAAAGGIELATASDMVTDVQSALGLTMDESTRLIDQMAKASSKTNTSVSQLGEAILTVGGTAKNMKGGTVELAQTLGLLADNGIKGAEGGTVLRNMILSLSAPTNEAKKALEGLGLSVFDSEGNMRSMQDIFTDLNSSLSTMTQGEQTQVLSQIFNKVDLKGVNALLGTNVERWGELTGAITASRGSAQQMADTQLDNLQGDVTLLKSAFEGLQIAVSDGLTPSIRDYVQLAGTGLQMVTKVLKEEGVGAAFEEIGFVVSHLALKLVKDIPDIVDAGLQLIESFGSTLVDNADVIIESAFKVFDTLADALLNPTAITELLTNVTSIVVKIADELTARAPTLIPAAINMILALVQGIIQNLPAILNAALQLVVALAQGIIDAIPSLIERLPELIDSLVAFLLESIPMLVDAGIQLITSIVSALPTIIKKIVEVLPEIIDSIITALMDAWPLLIDAGIELFTHVIEDLPTIITTIIEAIPTIITSIIDALLDHLPDMINGGVKLFMALVEALPDIILGLVKAVGSMLTAIFEAFTRSGPKFKDIGQKLIKAINEGIEKVKAWFGERWQAFIDGAKEKFTNLIDGAKSWGKDMIQNFIDGITAKFQALKKKVTDVANTVKGFLGFSVPETGPLSDADTYMPDFMELLAKGIRQTSGKVYSAASDLAEGIRTRSMPEVDLRGNLNGLDESAVAGNQTTWNVSINVPESIASDRDRVEYMARELESLMTRRNAYAI